MEHQKAADTLARRQARSGKSKQTQQQQQPLNPTASAAPASQTPPRNPATLPAAPPHVENRQVELSRPHIPIGAAPAQTPQTWMQQPAGGPPIPLISSDTRRREALNDAMQRFRSGLERVRQESAQQERRSPSPVLRQQQRYLSLFPQPPSPPGQPPPQAQQQQRNIPLYNPLYAQPAIVAPRPATNFPSQLTQEAVNLLYYPNLVQNPGHRIAHQETQHTRNRRSEQQKRMIQPQAA